ncbi:hypothetical protein [Pedobacter sp. SL55]|uniref:hypothetical protein n=1 Tax=Pedobacter sp. SL55 TaxID=2995161 RepID=UPI00226FD8C2|nr:hypothetical protein [Pedobacter sp. SL55]WAC40553.1 hypothetical protein OVA16_18610 [Pedobacter sp. SL55]
MRIECVLERICEALGANYHEVVSDTQKAEPLKAAYIATKILFERNYSPKDIQELFKRSRTNIYYRLDICNDRIEVEPTFKKLFNTAKQQTDELFNEIKQTANGASV